jgi:hypothetical protein
MPPPPKKQTAPRVPVDEVAQIHSSIYLAMNDSRAFTSTLPLSVIVILSDLFRLRLQLRLDQRWIKSVCGASQSSLMEAAVCLPGDVPQWWSDLEPRQ